MKIDIKNIANALAKGQLDERTGSKTLNIREALEEIPETPESPELPEEPVVLAVLQEGSEGAEPASEAVAEIDAAAEAEPAEDEEIEAGDASDADRAPAEEPSVPEEAIEPEEPEALEESKKPEEAEALEEPKKPEAQEELVEAEDVPPEEAETEEDVQGDEPGSSDSPAQDKANPFNKEKLTAWGRSYGWLTGIAASFVVLMIFLVVYTTMTPRQVYATINGEKTTFTTEAYTVEEFLADEKIEFCDEDYISIALTSYIQDGLAFELRHATDFTVTADGKTKKYKTLDNTVQQALDDVGVKLGENDIVTPKPETRLEKDMKIVVQRVVIQQEVVEEKIPFKTVNKDDVTMDEGTKKVVTEGKDGKDKVTYEITYIDGKESKKKEIKRETVAKAVDEVIANGTRVNYNGQSYSRKLEVKAYAYTGGGTTAMGTRARVGEIAVDPSVIPLGTNVYIEGVGARRAEDTGGNIQGNTIDIYMDTQSECLSWGVRYVTIYIE